MARGKIEVEGGLLDLLPAQDGLIENVAVQEGELVQKGQTLLRLNPEQAASDLAHAQAELQLAKAREAAQAARIPTAQKLAERTTAAVRAGAMDSQRATDALQAEQDIRAALSVAQAEVAVAQQRIVHAKQSLQRLTLTAPIRARIIKMQVQVGARVSPNMVRPMMVLLPIQPLIVRAELNQSFVARIKQGTLATVIVDNEDGPTVQLPELNARVIRLGETYGSSRLHDDASTRSNQRVVDCFLQFDTPPTGLRMGQEVRVRFYE